MIELFLETPLELKIIIMSGVILYFILEVGEWKEKRKNKKNY